MQRYFHLQGLWARGHTGRRGDRAQEPLPELLVKPARRRRAGRPCGRMRGDYGADRGLGARERRVGGDPPVQALRDAALEPGGGGRQPGQADVDRDEAAGAAAVPG